jgi:translocation and assembly module TamB
VAGSLVLEGGNLDANLDIRRLDGPGGALSAAANYRREGQTIDVDVTLTEPEDGILANLLNIEGRPPMALALKGSGPVADLRTEMTLDAGDVRALAGVATIRQAAGGFQVQADLRGPIAELMAEPYRPFFGAETALSVDALVRQEGGITVSGFTLGGGQLTLRGAAETAADGFLRRLVVDAAIADPGGEKVTLPLPGSATRLSRAALTIDFGAEDSTDWSGTLAVEGLETEDLVAETVALTADGVAVDLDQPAARRLTFNGDGMVSGIVAATPEVQEALGDSIGFGLAGLWNADEPLQLAELRLESKALSLVLAGAIQDFVFDGSVAVRTSSIAPFSGVAARDLAGALDLRAEGTVSPLIGGFSLTLDGTGTDLRLGDDALDAVLKGDVALSGRVARTEAGIEAEGFRIVNEQLTLAADGRFASTVADFDFRLDLADLALLSDQASGSLGVVGSARGTDGPITVDLTASVPSGMLVSRPLREAQLALNGTIEGTQFDGSISGAAFLDGKRVDLSAGLAAGPEQKRLSGLSFETVGTSATGDLTQDADGLLAGNLDIRAVDVSTAAALLLTEASGAIEAAVRLDAAGGEQNAEITASAHDLRAAGVAIASADLRAVASDLFGVPMLDGTMTARDVTAAGIEVATLQAQASRSGETTSFQADAALDNGATLAAAGSLAALGEGYRLALDRASLRQGEVAANLAQPVVLAVDGGTVRLDAVRFDVGSGRITASGTAGQAIDIAVQIEGLPLSIANAIDPDLGLSGTLRGTAQIGGTGSAPRANFALSGAGIGAMAIRPYGIAPLAFDARGTFADGAVQLGSLNATGAGGLRLAANGAIPPTGGGLALTVTGSAPLALGNQFVAERGGQLSGTANFDARLTGALSDPRITGRVSTSGSGYVDAELGLRLQQISGSASLSGDRIVIDSLNASLATGGTVSMSGSVALAAPNAAELRLQLNSARYVDADLLVATASGQLSLTGPLTQNPRLAGDIVVEEANIIVPETFGGAAALIEVEHVRPAPAVQATLARARLQQQGRAASAARPSVIQLDINLRAPNRVFVRGRGLDAEMGGSVRLSGPLNDIQPIGGFTLHRGRMSILGQRITFETGRVTLIGDLDPYLDFVARTQGQGISVFVTVSGRASDPDIGFSSNPALPEDEVLSRLIFNRSMGELSPLQLARLAGAAAELAGGGTSLNESLRSAAGLADLDIVTDEQGNVAVQAGQYIQDNIYLGVQAGADGQSRVTVDLDITDEIKARASAGADGDSSLGVFYEADY